jgi:DNA-directed RNA polymerase specialized sigma24 family protein
MLSNDEYRALQDVLDCCAAGDRDAWNQFALRLRDGLVQAATRFMHRRQDAEDAVQELFLSFWQHPERLRRIRPARLTALLAFIACRRHFQRLRRNHIVEVPLSGLGDVPEKHTGARALPAELDGFLAGLSRRLRDALECLACGRATDPGAPAFSPAAFRQSIRRIRRRWQAFPRPG